MTLISDAAQRVFYRLLYRPLIRLAHRFHWHYAPPVYPDGDTMLWCQWCGFRVVVKRRAASHMEGEG